MFIILYTAFRYIAFTCLVFCKLQLYIAFKCSVYVLYTAIRYIAFKCLEYCILQLDILLLNV